VAIIGTCFRYVFSALVCYLLVSSSMLKAEDRTLVILTWEDYIDPEIVSEFEQQNAVKLSFVYYEDDDARDLIMANSNATGFDLVLVDEVMKGSYQQQGWISAISTDAYPNLKFVEHPEEKLGLSGEVYAVPYFWGTIGILYHPDQFPEEITHWLDFFQPPENLKSKLLVLNTAQTAFGIALKALGYSVNSVSTPELEKAMMLLKKQRPFVKEYRNVLFDESEPLLKGELAAALTYNGDAAVLMEMNNKLRFVIPEDGSIFWYDSWIILSSSNQKTLASKFINFLNQPEVNARNAEFVSYATPNVEAKKFLSQEHLSNPISYPNASIMARLEVVKQLPLAVMKRIHTDFVTITHSSSQGVE